MKLWIDAQLSPGIAAWVHRTYEEIEAQSVRALGLRDALDHEIFEEARNQNVVIHPNATMKEILCKTLLTAKELLERGETVVEISDK